MAEMFKTRRNPIWGYTMAVLAGVGGWIYLAQGTPESDAWVNPQYFSLFVPVLAVLAAALGFFFPVRPWRWGLLLIWSQVPVALILSPAGTLLPTGLVVLLLLSLPIVGLAHLGGFARAVSVRGRGKRI